MFTGMARVQLFVSRWKKILYIFVIFMNSRTGRPHARDNLYKKIKDGVNWIASEIRQLIQRIDTLTL